MASEPCWVMNLMTLRVCLMCLWLRGSSDMIGVWCDLGFGQVPVPACERRGLSEPGIRSVIPAAAGHPAAFEIPSRPARGPRPARRAGETWLLPGKQTWFCWAWTPSRMTPFTSPFFGSLSPSLPPSRGADTAALLFLRPGLTQPVSALPLLNRAVWFTGQSGGR